MGFEVDWGSGGERATCPVCGNPLGNWPTPAEARQAETQHRIAEHPAQYGEATEASQGGKKRWFKK